MPLAVIGVGSCIKPEESLSISLQTLKSALTNHRISAIYRSPCVKNSGKIFSNIGIAGETPLPLESFRKKIKRIERDLKATHNDIDLDLYIYGSMETSKLPHTDISKYPFAIQIMLDLFPDGTHPTLGLHWKTIIEQFDCSHLHRLNAP